MQIIVQDIRYALRQLRKSPGFAATAVLTLALGIGATTAIFTLVYQVMLRSIPVSHPEQLYKVGKTNDCCVTGGLQDDWTIFSYDLYKYLRDQTPGTDGIAAVDAAQDTVSARLSQDRGAAKPLAIRFVSGNYFSVLAVRPGQGRLLTDADDREGAAPTAVISYAMWKSRFAADPRLVGSTLLLTGQPVTIVGITAPAFQGERETPDAAGVWVPLTQEPIVQNGRKLLHYPGTYWLDLVVRIKYPYQVAKVQLALQRELHQWIAANTLVATGGGKSTPQRFAQQTTELVSASGGINDLRDQYEKGLKLLLAVAGFVLLIACANLANLMLVRGMGRQQELAVRSALGAPRGRLVRQMLVEALLLSLAGGAAALAVAYIGTRGILALALRGTTSSPLDPTPSVPVLAFALGISLVTGILFGILPAWIASRTSPVEALRGANRSTRDASALPQKLLIIVQAALSLAMLSTAGLLIASLRSIEHQDYHFEPQGRMVVFLDLLASGYKFDQLPNLYRQLDDSFSHLPGVESFGYGTYTPEVGNNFGTGVFMPGDDPNSRQGASYAAVSPGFFSALGTKILLGRSMNDHDTATSAPVAVVNHAFVEKYLHGKVPIGIRFGTSPNRTSEFEIVGVADDTKYGGPETPIQPMFFTPITQTTTYTAPDEIENEQFKHFANNLVVHYSGDPAAAAASIRRILSSINPNMVIVRMSTYDEQLSTNYTEQELVVRLTTLFGLLALVLASIGLYGVTAYSVARRTSEIGIRMALGASRASVVTMIVRAALTQVVLGLAVGVPLAYLAARLLQSTLYQTNAFQPLVLFGVTVILILAALAASILPARRAAAIDPMQALRTD